MCFVVNNNSHHAIVGLNISIAIPPILYYLYYIVDKKTHVVMLIDKDDKKVAASRQPIKSHVRIYSITLHTVL